MTERDRLFLGHVLEAVAYFKIDLDALWAMVEKDLPLLKVNVRRMLGLK